ncbi:MAG: alpha/beta hydrolase [Pseudomonadota bacterium]
MKDRIISALVAFVALLFATQGIASPYEIPGAATHEIVSSANGRVYRLYVKTPPGYSRAENADRRYPAIFLNDGELFFLAAAGEPLLSYYNSILEETIVVGVSYAVGEDAIASRQRDLTPVKDESFANETGGGADYLRFLKNEAIPLIESAYRTDPARRTLAGHSFGATFGAYVLLTEPELFANYILVSPALWYADHSMAGIESVYARTHDDLPARVYMAVGDLEGPKSGLKAVDLVSDEIAFAARLRSRNYENLVLRDEVLDGGVSHSTSFPIAYLRALEWLLPVK